MIVPRSSLRLSHFFALFVGAFCVEAFQRSIPFTPIKVGGFATKLLQAQGEGETGETSSIADMDSPDLQGAASKFKIVTCMSTSCSKKREMLGMDNLSTFAAFYVRSKGEGDNLLINVEEGPCLGACKNAPCVAVEHDDFVGSVSLKGMTETEFSDRVFHNVITEEDAERVWSSITNAVELMTEDETGEI